eukprot:489736-Rhodomonas_salina.2
MATVEGVRDTVFYYPIAYHQVKTTSPHPYPDKGSHYQQIAKLAGQKRRPSRRAAGQKGAGAAQHRCMSSKDA